MVFAPCLIALLALAPARLLRVELEIEPVQAPLHAPQRFDSPAASAAEHHEGSRVASELVEVISRPLPAAQETQPFAVLRQRTPLEGTQVVRACLPLPPGFAFERGRPPFTVTRAGEEAPTQWELVSRYPGGDAAVVELLAQVKVPAGGREQRYEVHVRRPGATADPVPGAALALAKAGALELRAFDAEGLEYRGHLAASQPVSAHRLGPVATTTEHSGWLTPVQSDESALPRLIGFTAWTSLEAGSSRVGLELLLHTGPTSAPFPAKVYFRSVELVTPAGWDVEHLWPEPAAGGSTESGGRSVHVLVAPSPDGRMHVMLPRARREYRMLLHRGDRGGARAQLDAGHGFAVPVPGEGVSWCSSGAAGWGPAGFPLPDVTAAPWKVPRSALDASTHDKSAIWAAFAAGSKVAPGWDQGGAQGPFHPAGTHYGGTTGGAYIWQFEAQLALSGSPAQLAATKAWHRAITDRQRVGLYESDGRPVVLDAYSGWRIFSGQLQAEGPFRFGAADRRQEEQVHAAGLAPAYEAFLSAYSALDTEHLARRLSHSIALAWTDNDPIARREVLLQAELARAYFWDGPEGNLAKMLAGARAQRRRGSGGIGRAYGWTLQAAAAAWALGDDAHRARWRRWSEQSAELLSAAQMPNGMLQATTHGKLFQYGNGTAAMMQAIELGIVVNGAACMGNATGDARYFDVVRDAALGLARFAWKPGSSGPYAYMGTRPVDASLEAYATAAQVPAAALPANTDNFMIASTLAYGLCLLDGRPEREEILAAVRAYAGAASTQQIVPQLAKEGLKMFADSRAPLLSAVTGAKWPAHP